MCQKGKPFRNESNIAHNDHHERVIVELANRLADNMNPIMHRIQSALALITGRLRKILGIAGGDFASQRMCPFCGLITPRSNTCCLECGKSFKPA
jgi:hypothetical protein